MDWNFWAWGEAIARGSGAPESTSRPSSQELSLIHVLCEALARESLCSRCGAPLRGQVMCWPEPDTAPDSWTLLAETTCTNWRRHRQTARVTEEGGHLTFGAFRR